MYITARLSLAAAGKMLAKMEEQAMSNTVKTYPRFVRAQRIEHFILIFSFTILGITGLPQMFPLSPIAQGVVTLLGGIELMRIIHRISATVFLLEGVYHFIFVGYVLFVRRGEASMIPTIKDGTDAIQQAKFNLGLSNERPKMPRFNFAEKAEYLAMLWGFVVMAGTGFMLWNPIATTQFLPGVAIPAAKIAHGWEAVLAVLAIILWHFYHVHLRFFNKSIFTGRIDHHEMAVDHGHELERIEQGLIPPPPPAPEMRKRLSLFAPIAAVATVAMIGGVIWFITLETSAITTLPEPQRVAAFVPRTPTPWPTATPAPTADPNQAVAGSLDWEGTISSLFITRCGACHGTLGGFSAQTYADVMEGVEPGDPDNSLVLTVQQGSHPGMFTSVEMEQVIDWIAAGAPESGGEAVAAPVSALTWSGAIQQQFRQKCIACHGSMGGFSAETYEDVMQAVVPGDPDNSVVVQSMQRVHPGLFTPEQLDALIQWIAAGAPE
jgi:cytochrome b subunit of formate dehydrogenase/mono/diheme cytochrome c family protein